MASSDSTSRLVARELVSHAPFTVVGAICGIGVMVVIVATGMPRPWSHALFATFHPLHVLLSALTTTAMFRRHGGTRWWAVVAVGYIGSVGIATLSDSLIPYLGETLLRLPHAAPHVGFLEEWWLVNPMAAAGIALGYLWSRTKYPHAAHVLLSTAASLFHVAMAMGAGVSPATWIVVFVFLFLSVWLPCCVSDIVFPLLFCREGAEAHRTHQCSCHLE